MTEETKQCLFVLGEACRVRAQAPILPIAFVLEKACPICPKRLKELGEREPTAEEKIKKALSS